MLSGRNLTLRPENEEYKWNCFYGDRTSCGGMDGAVAEEDQVQDAQVGVGASGGG